MIYNETKKPLFIHFYASKFYSNFTIKDVETSVDAESIYEASSNGIPVIGILHNCFDENSVRVYTADEAVNILQSGDTFETPCIIDMTYQGEAIPLLDASSSDTFSFIEALDTWKNENETEDILLKAKLYDNYPYDYYYFFYNKGIEQSDMIDLKTPTYQLTIVGRGSGSEIIDYSDRSDSNIMILPLFCTSKAALDSDSNTYYAVFQYANGTGHFIIQMKNDLIRLAENADDDMVNWEEHDIIVVH